MKNTPILILIFSANLMHGMGGWINTIKNALDYLDCFILKSCIPNTTSKQFQNLDVKAAKKNLTPAPSLHYYINNRKTIEADYFEKRFFDELNKHKLEKNYENKIK
jgi:hypothetical protein